MFRSNPLTTYLLALGAVACRGAGPIADQLPAHVPRRQVASTVWIGVPTEEGLSGFASAIVLGPRHLLTSAHAWAEDDPWWASELPVV